MNRLNLSEQHCTRLRVYVHTKLSADIADRVVGGSYTYGHPSDANAITTYASSYTLRGTAYAVTGQVRSIGADEYHVEIDYEPSDLGRPPRDMKPVDAMVEHLGSTLQNRYVESTATFRYPVRDGFASKIPLPMPYLLGDETFNHIDGIVLARRDEGRILHRVEVSLSPSEQILRHHVYMRATHDSLRQVPRIALGAASRLSRSLIYRAQSEEGDARP